MAKTADDKQKFMDLRARGYSYAKIGEIVGVSKPTLIKWNRQFAAEIEQMKSDEMEALCERFRLSREYRVERFAGVLDRIESQLDDRNLADVNTDRLVRLWVNVMTAVRKELEPARTEISGRVEVANPLERWEEIIRQCIEVETVKEISDLAGALAP